MKKCGFQKHGGCRRRHRCISFVNITNNITVLKDYSVKTQYLIKIKISDITTKTFCKLRVKMAKQKKIKDL